MINKLSKFIYLFIMSILLVLIIFLFIINKISFYSKPAKLPSEIKIENREKYTTSLNLGPYEIDEELSTEFRQSSKMIHIDNNNDNYEVTKIAELISSGLNLDDAIKEFKKGYSNGKQNKLPNNLYSIRYQITSCESNNLNELITASYRNIIEKDEKYFKIKKTSPFEIKAKYSFSVNKVYISQLGGKFRITYVCAIFSN